MLRTEMSQVVFRTKQSIPIMELRTEMSQVLREPNNQFPSWSSIQRTKQLISIMDKALVLRMREEMLVRTSERSVMARTRSTAWRRGSRRRGLSCSSASARGRLLLVQRPCARGLARPGTEATLLNSKSQTLEHFFANWERR
jgi:hypothetical protein